MLGLSKEMKINTDANENPTRYYGWDELQKTQLTFDRFSICFSEIADYAYYDYNAYQGEQKCYEHTGL